MAYGKLATMSDILLQNFLFVGMFIIVRRSTVRISDRVTVTVEYWLTTVIATF